MISQQGPQHRFILPYLDRAIEQFESNPAAGHFMRRLAKEDPDLFFTAAAERLISPILSPGLRFLARVVTQRPALLRRLASPALGSRDKAISLFRCLLEAEPFSDIRLAHLFPMPGVWAPDALDGAESERTLDILDATSKGFRLLPLLGHLTESQDPRISAKATLFVGKRVRSPEWAERQLSRTDPRVRANALEGLWGSRDPKALRIFEDCVEDGSNRVSGNALVGLHAARPQDAEEILLIRSASPDARLRATAAWAMGQTGGELFHPRLAYLIRDEYTEVRSMALRAIAQLRCATQAPASGPDYDKDSEKCGILRSSVCGGRVPFSLF
ncbi:MAG TPA: HEAT repeat domain-containing protein [Bryobacteraceae bacterium]|nr:HEAT repeat domain-containing protein [Bryobacteraceae bacterium]